MSESQRILPSYSTQPSSLASHSASFGDRRAPLISLTSAKDLPKEDAAVALTQLMASPSRSFDSNGRAPSDNSNGEALPDNSRKALSVKALSDNSGKALSGEALSDNSNGEALSADNALKIVVPGLKKSKEAMSDFNYIYGLDASSDSIPSPQQTLYDYSSDDGMPVADNGGIPIDHENSSLTIDERVARALNPKTFGMDPHLLDLIDANILKKRGKLIPTDKGLRIQIEPQQIQTTEEEQQETADERFLRPVLQHNIDLLKGISYRAATGPGRRQRGMFVVATQGIHRFHHYTASTIERACAIKRLHARFLTAMEAGGTTLSGSGRTTSPSSSSDRSANKKRGKSSSDGVKKIGRPHKQSRPENLDLEEEGTKDEVMTLALQRSRLQLREDNTKKQRVLEAGMAQNAEDYKNCHFD